VAERAVVVDMFSYLPSVLNTWQYAGALSSAVQRRVLFYVLKRTLGHLIQDNEFRLDQIEAGTVAGKIEIRGVHLDADVSAAGMVQAMSPS
jgi:autophagy-related protein 2